MPKSNSKCFLEELPRPVKILSNLTLEWDKQEQAKLLAWYANQSLSLASKYDLQD